jgi:hypothetical protein
VPYSDVLNGTQIEKLRMSMLADPIEQMRESTQIVFEWKYAPI